MDKDECSCSAEGRLLIYVESNQMSQVRIMIMEQSGYRDFYTIYLQNGIGKINIDNIALGTLRIESNIDSSETIYYPGNIILFKQNDYIHKLNIIDRRKKSE